MIEMHTTSPSSNVKLCKMDYGTESLSDNAGAIIFLHLWSGYHKDTNIMKSISTLLSSLAFSELKS